MPDEAPDPEITRLSFFRRFGKKPFVIKASVVVACVLAYWLIIPSYVAVSPPHPSFIKHRQNIWGLTSKTKLVYSLTKKTYWVWRTSAMVSAKDELESATRGGWTSAADGLAFLSTWAKSRGWQAGDYYGALSSAEEVYHKETCAATFRKPGNRFLTLYLGVSPFYDERGRHSAYRLSITTSNASFWTRTHGFFRLGF